MAEAASKTSKAAAIAPSKRSPQQFEQSIAGDTAEILALQQSVGNRAVSEQLSSADSSPSAVPTQVRFALRRSSGQPLDPALRSEMKSRFDQAGVQTHVQPASRDRSEQEADRVASQVLQPARFRQREAAATPRPADLNFDRVRIHADESAAASARSVQALAYTVGKDIVFAAGQYQPASTVGKQLIAHELAHVVQQRSQTALQRQPAPDATLNAPTEQDLLAAFQEFKLKYGKEPGKELQDWARQYQLATGQKVTLAKLDEAREFRRIWQQYPKLPQKAAAEPKDAKLPPGDIGANEVLPFAKGTRVLITQLIDRVISKSLLDRAADFFKDKSSSSFSFEDKIPLLIDLFTDPNVTKSVTATISESTPQQVVVSVDIPKIPAKGTRPEFAAMTANLTLEHIDPRLFDLIIKWQRGGTPDRIIIGGIGAERSANGNILVSRKGDSIKLELTRDAGGQVGAQLVNLPALARMFVKEPVKLIQMEPLSAPVGSAEVTKEQESRTAAARSKAAPLGRNELLFGTGLHYDSQAGTQALYSIGWRFTFKPLGNLVQLPLQFQLDYLPKESGLVGGSFGLQTTLPSALPVTLRVLPGLKTGLMTSPATDSAPAATVPVFGASIGLGAGLELKPGVNLQLDAQHFQNFLDKGPKGAQSVVLGASFNL